MGAGENFAFKKDHAVSTASEKGCRRAAARATADNYCVRHGNFFRGQVFRLIIANSQNPAQGHSLNKEYDAQDNDREYH